MRCGRECLPGRNFFAEILNFAAPDSGGWDNSEAQLRADFPRRFFALTITNGAKAPGLAAKMLSRAALNVARTSYLIV